MKNHHNKPLPRVVEDHPVAAPLPPVAAGFDPPAAPSLPATIPFAPTAPPDIAPSHLVDDHGFDPARYQWVPVLRRPRADGWTPQRQQEFISALADSGCVAIAAREVDMAESGAYRLRRAPGSENFAAAWDAAIANASARLVDVAFQRAIRGTDEAVYNRDGDIVGRRHIHHDRLLIFLLKAYHPDRFRYAERDQRPAHEPAAPPLPSLGEALDRLEPVRPARPELGYTPEDLAEQLDMAEIGKGKLPHWFVGKRDGPDFVPDEASPMIDALLDKLRAGEKISFDETEGPGEDQGREGNARG